MYPFIGKITDFTVEHHKIRIIAPIGHSMIQDFLRRTIVYTSFVEERDKFYIGIEIGDSFFPW